MNKNNNLEKELPPTTSIFQLDIQGSVTGKRFLGEFECKIPTIKDQSLIAKHFALLNGQYPVYLEEGMINMHRMLAYLKYTITDCPTFWKSSDYGYELRDYNVIEAIYNEVLQFEEKWLAQIWGTNGQQ